MGTTGAPGEGETAPVRRRLAPEERERRIVEEAIRFFAEEGFKGQTRELAQRLGITQPLLYRYFPTKQDLIERVYEEVYLTRWNPDWAAGLKDRSVPLRERLIRFYRDYMATILERVWLRIYMFSGLMGEDINRRYIRVVEDEILRPTILELRHECGLPGAEEVPITGEEIELAWAMQGGIFYTGVRRHIYGIEIEAPLDDIIEAAVDELFEGAGPVLRRLAKP